MIRQAKKIKNKSKNKINYLNRDLIKLKIKKTI